MPDQCQQHQHPHGCQPADDTVHTWELWQKLPRQLCLWLPWTAWDSPPWRAEAPLQEAISFSVEASGLERHKIIASLESLALDLVRLADTWRGQLLVGILRTTQASLVQAWPVHPVVLICSHQGQLSALQVQSDVSAQPGIHCMMAAEQPLR